MKHGYSTLDMEECYDNEWQHKTNAEQFENDVAKAKAILSKVSRLTFHGYYLACFTKSNNNYAFNRRFIKFRN